MRILALDRRRVSDNIRQDMAQLNEHHIHHSKRYDCANEHCPEASV
jgi:hypothetical protein